MQLKKDLNFKLCIFIAVAAGLLRLFVASRQMMQIYPLSAPIDDDLYFNMANSIARGQWLGQYNYLTLSKYPFFSVYLAAVHFSGLPYLVANARVMIACALFCLWAFAPVVKSNLYRLSFYLLFIFNPATMAGHNLRVYRDTIFPYLCIGFFAGLAGYALRLGKKKNRVFLLIAGLCLGMAYTTREDGYWVLPFGAAAALICRVYIFKNEKIQNKRAEIAKMAAPYAICRAFVLTFSALNYKYYGRFVLSDFSGGEFARCYGAMTRLPHENWHPLIDVPEDVREKLYENCPSFRPFYQYIDDENSKVRKSYLKQSLGDYQSGSLYWALRRRAQELGYYQTAEASEKFWGQLADEVEALREDTPGALPPRASLTPPIKAEYVLPTIQEAKDSLVYIFTLKDFTGFRDSLSDMTTGQIEIWQDFLHEDANYAAFENTDIPYATPAQQLTDKFIDFIIAVYRLIFAPAAIIRAVLCLRLFAKFKEQPPERQILAFVVLGLVLMGVFRVFIIAFMEVAAFDIGTYAMYLGPVYLLFALTALLAPAMI